MTAIDILSLRLRNQHISLSGFDRPEQVASWFGGMQAQDYSAVIWAIGLRCSGATAQSVEGAIGSKAIIRTWLMRGTIQAAAASDVGWMLELLAPRLISQSQRRLNELELDKAALSRSFKSIEGALLGGNCLSRSEILSRLEQAGVSAKGARGYHILRQAGLRALICFGPNQDKQQTFRLLDEAASRGPSLTREEALTELAARYFGSHGPAAMQDFIWWSGLTAADARAGVESITAQLAEEVQGSQSYWFNESSRWDGEPAAAVYLLPAYDEYYLGYSDRDIVLDAKYDRRAVSSSGIFRPMIVIEGKISGTWTKKLKKNHAAISLAPFESLTETKNKALLAAAEEYGNFLGLPVEVY